LEEEREKTLIIWLEEEREKTLIIWLEEEKEKTLIIWLEEEREKTLIIWLEEEKEKTLIIWLEEEREKTLIISYLLDRPLCAGDSRVRALSPTYTLSSPPTKFFSPDFEGPFRQLSKSSAREKNQIQ
jgi:hypothetical protein